MYLCKWVLPKKLYYVNGDMEKCLYRDVFSFPSSFKWSCVILFSFFTSFFFVSDLQLTVSLFNCSREYSPGSVNSFILVCGFRWEFKRRRLDVERGSVVIISFYPFRESQISLSGRGKGSPRSSRRHGRYGVWIHRKISNLRSSRLLLSSFQILIP